MLFAVVKQIGDPLQTFQFNIRRKSKQTIIIDWFDDEGLSDAAVEIDGLPMKIVIGDRDAPDDIWDTTVVNNSATWDITEAMSDLPFSIYRGCVVLSDQDGAESIILNLKVVVAPPAE